MLPDIASTRWFERAAIIGGIGAIFYALDTIGAIIPFSIGCSCFCPPFTNTQAWFASLLILFPSMIAAILAASAFTSKNPFSLERHWSATVAAMIGFLMAGGGLLRASIILAGQVLPQAVGLVFGASLLALAAPVALVRRVRPGAALGAIGAVVIGLSGLFPIISINPLFGVRTTWETVVAATLQMSLVGHPFVMFSVAATLALLAIGVHKNKVMAVAAAPTAVLTALSFIIGAYLVAGSIEYLDHIFSYEAMPGPYKASSIINVSVRFVGPTLLGIAGAIATVTIVLELVRGGR